MDIKKVYAGSLFDRLMRYAASDYYPFHMPGHKRQGSDMFSIDITEIDGFDDLHHAEGILKDSMEQAAGIYGSDESCYLINGSSGGILSAVSGCVTRNGKILIGRNCHRSVYNGIFLNGLETVYLYPQIMEGLGIQGGISAEDVEKALRAHPDTQAVMIVSPTYEGIVSDVGKIAQAAHDHGIPLIVDEAHGAHFSFAEEGSFPRSALVQGADVVIQSLHKTLPCFTQTGIIHMKKGYLGQERMERIKAYLSIYQSSSPSYLFLASIEGCILYMEQEGKEKLEELARMLEVFRERCKDLKSIYVPGREWVGKAGIYDMDPSKIVMSTGYGKRNGIWLDDHLRRSYHLELEMKEAGYALALTSLWDRKEGLERLFQGLRGADRLILEEMEKGHAKTGSGMERKGSWKERMIRQEIFQERIMPRSVCKIQEAKEKEWEECRIDDCAGRAAADFIYLYPPGIPCLTPGEIVSEKLIEKIKLYDDIGASVHGLKKEGDAKKIRVIKG